MGLFSKKGDLSDYINYMNHLMGKLGRRDEEGTSIFVTGVKGGVSKTTVSETTGLFLARNMMIWKEHEILGPDSNIDVKYVDADTENPSGIVTTVGFLEDAAIKLMDDYIEENMQKGKDISDDMIEIMKIFPTIVDLVKYVETEGCIDRKKLNAYSVKTKQPNLDLYIARPGQKEYAEFEGPQHSKLIEALRNSARFVIYDARAGMNEIMATKYVADSDIRIISGKDEDSTVTAIMGGIGNALRWIFEAEFNPKLKKNKSEYASSINAILSKYESNVADFYKEIGENARAKDNNLYLAICNNEDIGKEGKERLESIEECKAFKRVKTIYDLLKFELVMGNVEQGLGSAVSFARDFQRKVKNKIGIDVEIEGDVDPRMVKNILIDPKNVSFCRGGAFRYISNDIQAPMSTRDMKIYGAARPNNKTSVNNYDKYSILACYLFGKSFEKRDYALRTFMLPDKETRVK